METKIPDYGFTGTAEIALILTLVPFGICFLYHAIRSCFWVKKGEKLKEIKDWFVYLLCCIPGSCFLWFGIFVGAFASKKYGMLITLGIGFSSVIFGMVLIIYAFKILEYFYKFKESEKE